MQQTRNTYVRRHSQLALLRSRLPEHQLEQRRRFQLDVESGQHRRLHLLDLLLDYSDPVPESLRYARCLARAAAHSVLSSACWIMDYSLRIHHSLSLQWVHGVLPFRVVCVIIPYGLCWLAAFYWYLLRASHSSPSGSLGYYCGRD